MKKRENIIYDHHLLTSLYKFIEPLWQYHTQIQLYFSNLGVNSHPFRSSDTPSISMAGNNIFIIFYFYFSIYFRFNWESGPT